MKRIKAAYVCKLLNFLPKEDLPAAVAGLHVQREVAQYKHQLERSRTRYSILREEAQADGSILLEIKMQYNSTPVGAYFAQEE